MFNRGKIDPLSFVGKMTTKRYLKILENAFIPIQQNYSDFDKMWFIQNNARIHRTKIVFTILQDQFGNRILVLGYLEANVFSEFEYSGANLKKICTEPPPPHTQKKAITKLETAIEDGNDIPTSC